MPSFVVIDLNEVNVCVVKVKFEALKVLDEEWMLKRRNANF